MKKTTLRWLTIFAAFVLTLGATTALTFGLAQAANPDDADQTTGQQVDSLNDPGAVSMALNEAEGTNEPVASENDAGSLEIESNSANDGSSSFTDEPMAVSLSTTANDDETSEDGAVVEYETKVYEVVSSKKIQFGIAYGSSLLKYGDINNFPQDLKDECVNKGYATVKRTVETLTTSLSNALKISSESTSSPKPSVQLNKNLTLKNSLSIPAGVTLIIPCKDNDPGYIGGFSPEAETNNKQPNAYRTLSIPSGVTLTVENDATVLVNAEVGYPSTTTQDVGGGYGTVNLNGEVIVKDGGMYDSQGYTLGSGSVSAESGGTVRDLFVIDHWRGGSQAKDAQSAKVTPMNEYHIHNIETKVTIAYNANYEGTAKIYTADTDKLGIHIDARTSRTNFKQVGPSNALIRLSNENSRLEKTYDKKTGRETYTIYNGASFESGTLSFTVGIVPVTIESSVFVYAWNGIYDFNLLNGEYDFNYDFKFMPGAKVYAENSILRTNNRSSGWNNTTANTLVFYSGTFNDQYTNGYGTNKYPSGRGDATLTLGENSKLINNGNFAGKVILNGGELEAGNTKYVKWGKIDSSAAEFTDQVKDAVKTEEIQNGETKFDVYTELVRDGYSWSVDPDSKEITWVDKYESLNAAIAAATKVDKDSYTQDSLNNLNSYVTAGEKFLEDSSTSQEDADKAAKDILDAISKLVKRANYQTLNTAIENAQRTFEFGNSNRVYTEKTWDVFVSAYQSAQNIQGQDLDENGQGDIDEAAATLNSAFGALEKAADFSSLSKTIEEASSENESNYTNVSWSALQSAMEEARKVLGQDLSVGQQSTVDNEVLALQAAIDALDPKADFSALKDEVAKEADLNPDRYIESAWTAYTKALAEAKALQGQDLGQRDGQELIDAACRNLAAARKELESNVKTFTITFVAGEGTIAEGMDEVSVFYGEALTGANFPQVSAPRGKTFDGWTEDGKPVAGLDNVTAEHTLTASWVPESYGFSIDLAGGDWASDADAANVKDRETYTVEDNFSVAVPVKEGHTFTGWTVNGEDLKDAEAYKVEDSIGDLSFVANWTANKYKVTWDLADGTDPTTVDVTFGDAVTRTNPTRTGHTFAGWQVTKTGSEDLLFTELPKSMPAQDITITATWKANEYKVTWDLNDKTSSKVTEDVAFGTPITRDDEPTRIGYTFSGWKVTETATDALVQDGLPVTMPDKAITITAQWTPNTYTITFAVDEGEKLVDEENVLNGGTTLDVVYDSPYGNLPTAEKDGAKFNGWKLPVEGEQPAEIINSLSTVQITDDVTVTPDWTYSHYTIDYTLGTTDYRWPEGTTDADLVKEYEVTTDTFTIPNPECDGYDFLGWTNGKDGTPQRDFTVKQGTFGNLDLYAHWAIRTYDIVFQANGGTFTNQADDTIEITREHFQQIGDVPAIERNGYKFLGWSGLGSTNLSSEEVATTEVSGNLTLKAEWEIINYKFSVDLDGGSFAIGDPNATRENYTVNDVITLVDPTKIGHVFAGWTISVDDAPATEFSGAIIANHTGDIHLTALWSAESYNVTFKGNGGTFAGALEENTTSHAYNTAIGKPEEPSRNGYTFAGWLKDGETLTAEQVAALLTPATDITFTAQWTAIDYPLHIDLAQGEWGSASSDSNTARTTYTIEDEFALPTPKRFGYEFAGWTRTGMANEANPGQIMRGTTGEITLTAKWNAVKSQLTWVLWDGNVQSSSTEYGATITVPSVSAEGYRPGFRFDGWTITEGAEPDQDTKVPPTTMPAHALTIEARWTSYQTLLEELTNDLSQLKGDRLTEARGYFAKLNDEQIKSYDATNLYKAIEAEQEQAIRAAVSAAIPKSVNPALSNIATLTEGEPVDGVPTLYVEISNPDYPAANMLSNTFLQDLFAYDGITTVTIGNEEPCPKEQFALMLNVAWTAIGRETGAKDKGMFTNWLYERVDTLTVGSLAGSAVRATLNAKPSPEGVAARPSYQVCFYIKGHAMDWQNYKTITFDTGCDAKVDPIMAKAGMAISAPTNPERIGYTFEGWYKGVGGTGERFESGVMPNESITLYAKWAPISYKVAFDVNGGSGAAPSDITATYDKDFNVPTTQASKRGYTFKGWTDGTTTYAPNTNARNLANVQDAKVTLKAVWEPNSYSVTLDPNGGELDEGVASTFKATFDAAYGSAFEGGKLPEPTRQGYKFAGWTLDGVPVTSGTPVSRLGSHTLKAQWNEAGDMPYSIQFWQQDVEGNGTTLLKTVGATGATNSTATATPEDFTGFTLNEGASTLSDTIAADGSTVLKLVYDRNVYQVNWFTDKWVKQSYRYEQPIVAPNAELLPDDNAAYTFKGWKLWTPDATDVPAPDAAPAAATDLVDLTNAIATADANYQAVYDLAYEASINEGDVTFRTLDVAMQKAMPGDVVTLEQDVTLAKDLTVPTGVTLLLPYKADDPGYVPNYQGDPFNPDNPDLHGKLGFAGDPDPYRTLTVAKGATLNVKGTVMVNALTGRPRAGNYDQDITGGWARVQVDGRVVVGSGGTFDSFGLTQGDGSVRVLKGGTVGDLFLVKNWRGGSQAAAVFGYGVYPYNEYDCRNVEVPLIIDAGGALEGLVKMYASGAYYTTRFPLVDPENGLMRQQGSALAATPDQVTRTVSDAGEHFDVDGSTTFSRSTLTILGIDASTGDYLYPIDGDISWTIRNGDFTFDEDYKFLTGSTVTAENAQIRVNEGDLVTFYQAFDDPENTDGTAYPKRTAAALSLDVRSSLTNDGTFAGKVKAAAPTVLHGAMDVAWESRTLEANGYYSTKPFGQETKELTNDLAIDITGHTYEISQRGEILWDGAESEFQPADEIAEIIKAEAATITDEDNDLKVESVVNADGSITWNIAIGSERAAKSAVGTAEDVVSEFLRALAAKTEIFQSATALSEADDYLVVLADGVSGYDVRMFTESLGLVDAAKAQAQARPNALDDASVDPIAADLDGVTAKILVKGTEAYPVDTTITLAFSAEAPAEEEPEPEAPEKTVPVYRLFNRFDELHLFTTDLNEVTTLEQRGWENEGPYWYVPMTGTGYKTIIRLYNPYNSTHYYLGKDDTAQLNGLLAAGWVQDSESSWFDSADPATGTPVRTLYNRYSSTDTHLWTPLQNEFNELRKLGWEENATTIYASPNPEG